MFMPGSVCGWGELGYAVRSGRRSRHMHFRQYWDGHKYYFYYDLGEERVVYEVP